MKLALAAATLIAVLVGATRIADAEPDPKRKVVVLEYRSGSSALPGIAKRVVGVTTRLTSLQVLGPDQTRAVIGDQLDQTVARCEGDSACIAGIGRRAGAADVMLIGISELGDVILTLQRIQVDTGRAVTRVADSFAPGAVPSEDQLNGYLARLLAPTDFVRYGIIDIVASHAGAAVTVGGQDRGATPIEPLKLPAPATYDIRVEKAGFVPFTTRVALPPDGEVKVEAALSRRGGPTAWYQRWYVLAGAGVFVAGAAGTAIYFGTRSTSSDRVPVTGVLQ